MPRSIEEVTTYYKDALRSIPMSHPHYQEVYDLLNAQVADELRDVYNYTYSFSD